MEREKWRALRRRMQRDETSLRTLDWLNAHNAQQHEVRDLGNGIRLVADTVTMYRLMCDLEVPHSLKRSVDRFYPSRSAAMSALRRAKRADG